MRIAIELIERAYSVGRISQAQCAGANAAARSAF